MLHWKLSAIANDDGTWNVDVLQNLLPDHLIVRIMAHPGPLAQDEIDARYWPWNSSGEFSVSTAYDRLRSVNPDMHDAVWKKVWNL